MLPTIPAKELPLTLRAMAKDLELKQRKYLVLPVARGANLTGSSFRATLGGITIEQVPYAEGGGYRTTSPVFCALDFGSGKYWFGVAPLPGQHTFTSIGDVSVACDYWLQTIEGEGKGSAVHHHDPEMLREQALEHRSEAESIGAFVSNNETVINDATGELALVTDASVSTTGSRPVRARSERTGREITVGRDGKLSNEWAVLRAALYGLAGNARRRSSSTMNPPSLVSEERDMGDKLRRGLRREEEEWLASLTPEERAFQLSEIARLRAKYSGTVGRRRAGGFMVEEELLEEDLPQLGGARRRSGTQSPVILVEAIEDNGEREVVGEYSLAAMLRDNADDDYVVEQLSQLQPGQSFEVGGGAAPRMRMTYQQQGVDA